MIIKLPEKFKFFKGGCLRVCLFVNFSLGVEVCVWVGGGGIHFFLRSTFSHHIAPP